MARTQLPAGPDRQFETGVGMAPPTVAIDLTPAPAKLPKRLLLALAGGQIGLALLLSSSLPDDLQRMISGIALSSAGLALTGACWHRAHLSTGARKISWHWFSGSALAAALGNFLLTFGDLNPAPTVGRVGEASVLIAVGLLLAGLLAYPFGPRRAYDVVRLLLDTVVLGGAILLILGNTVLPRIDENLNTGTLALMIAPVIDIVITTVLWLLLIRAPVPDRLPLALAAAAFALISVSEVLAEIARATTGFSFGTPVDLGWICGYLLLAIVIWWAPSSFPAPGDEDSIDRSPVASSIVMFTVVLTAVALRLVAVANGSANTTSMALLAVVIVAMLLRQLLLLLDNYRLRATLEQRVVDRTAEVAAVTQRSDLLLTAVEDGVYGVDHQGLVSFVNPAGARMLLAGREQLLGRSAHQLFHTHPPDTCYLHGIQQTGVAITGLEDSYRDSAGQLVPVEVSASPLLQDNSVRGVVVVFRDVTRRREVDQMKSEFVSHVSHELRTPLTAIRGSLGLLSGGALGELTPPASRMIEIALESSERLTRLINQVLDLERLDSGMPLQIGTYPAADLLKSAQQQVQLVAGESGVTVVISEASGEVAADADRVVQVIINLLANAIKYSSPNTQVVLSAELDADSVLFGVRDHGRGIPADRLVAIFERFIQIDSSDSRDKGGTGLGLAISRSIVERLGGRIWAENNSDAGATFWFTLPRSITAG